VADLVRKALGLGSDMSRTTRSWPTECARSARYHFWSFSILGVAVGMHVFVGDGDLMQVRHILFRKGKVRFASPKCNALLESVLWSIDDVYGYECMDWMAQNLNKGNF
jgi:hypothetical protein